ncbi:Nha1 protein [Saccharomycopsis crataegensis]|uniref:Nha1 protein n=1 Tax=Saccharomycopsis crataegensis TaxID=43959 RepID=A0AAV5QDY7_9ASCO|nr:Nha1 protein [Saccharomycopsis crataegensis]
MVWEHLNIDKAHIAYAVIGVFTVVFSLISLIVKEKLYIGEATVATIYGLIVGPHCLDWFAPTTWGNSDYITLELSRITLVVSIFAVAVELPKKYMLRHWLSVFILLVPVMTAGWLIVGAFIYLLIPNLNFSDSLIISACITATDPVLAAAVVGKGKFAQRVPGHLRNILSAESGCNDGMAFPFIYLGLNLVIHHGHAGEIIKDWICVSILYECVFGCILGVIIGYCGRHAIKFAEAHNLIDRESFLAFYIVLALMCAGFGSMLGVDDLLVSFAAGATFAWDGWFAKKTEETHVSTVIDLLLNMSYFVYFGAIIPWEQFNNPSIGTDVWRLIVLAIVVLFLRRIPAVLALKPFIPDIKTWREALFCGHFGPIGVGAVFAAILARGELESVDTDSKTPLKELPLPGSPNYQLIACIWPIVCFLIISSIIVHGSSVAVFTLGRHLNSMAISMSYTATNTANTTGTTWLNRLPKLDTNGRSFSLQRVDTKAIKRKSKKKKKKNNNDKDDDNIVAHEQILPANTIETSGIKYRPAGGMDKKKRRKRRQNRLSKSQSRQDYLEKRRPAAEQFYLSKDKTTENNGETDNEKNQMLEAAAAVENKTQLDTSSGDEATDEKLESSSSEKHQKLMAYGEGNKIIVEAKNGEVIDTINLEKKSHASDNDEDSDKSFDSDEEKTRSKRRPLSRVASAISNKSGSPSSLTRISSAKQMKNLVHTLSGRKKAYAYKVDNYLVIENEDGEVVRRYEIHQHDKDDDGASIDLKPASGSLMGKTLSAVGLKKLTSDGPVEGENSNKKVNSATYKTENDGEEEADTEADDGDDDDDDATSSEEESDESEPDEETEVEKRRRLAALSKSPLPRDENDEEES